jgi:hypothetical protein
MSAEPGNLPQDGDSEGCLCVVASYSDLAPAVGPLVAEAARRIMMSPALGDFIELRFTDIGPRPGPAGTHSDAAVAILVDQLMHPASGVGRNYFALVIADASATTAEELLNDCAAVPAVASLPILLRGIASSEDRQMTPGTGQAMEIVVPATGSWSQDAFVDGLRNYGEELLQYFATGHKPGLTRDELDLLRSKNDNRTPQPSGSVGDEPGASLEPEREIVTQSRNKPVPDILTPQITPTAIDQPSHASSRQSPGTPEESSRTPKPTPLPLPAQAPRPRRLWRPLARSRRGHEAESETGTGDARTGGLVYLIIVGDGISADHSAWHKGRSVLLDMDAKIAVAPLFAFKVRALGAGQDSVRGTLREAGQLSRRDIKQPVTDSDFASVLGSIRTMLKIDRATIQATDAPMAWPAVVFFATDPPLADTATADMYRELAREASIIWIVPRDSADLMAPVFTEAQDTLLLVYHQEVAGEIVSLLTSSTRIREANPQVH